MILRFIFTVIVLYLIFRVLKRILRSAEKKKNEPLSNACSRTIQGGDLVQDPCCLTYIPEGEAYKASIGGEILYFCSEACFKKYQMERKEKS